MFKSPGIVAVFVFTVLAALPASQLQGPETRKAERLEFEIPEQQKIINTGSSIIAISRDGRQFAYCTTGGIYVCSGNPPVARLLPGTQGSPSQPFFSPDGKWIGYWSGDEVLKRAPIDGGDAVSFPPNRVAGPISGAHWFAEDSIIYSLNGRAIVQISANGKKRKVLFESRSEWAVYPQLLPDGNSVLYSALKTEKLAESKVAIRSLRSGEDKTVWLGTKARYLPTGHLVYKAADHTIMAVPFDLTRLEVTGRPATVVTEAWYNGAIQYAIADTGALVYIQDDPKVLLPKFNLVWVSHDGREEPLGAEDQFYSGLSVSPDGKHLAVSISGRENGGIWIWDFAQRTMARFSSDPDAKNPAWISDGRKIEYRSSPDSKNIDLFSKPVDGSGGAEKLASVPKEPYIFHSARNEKEFILLRVPGTRSEYPPKISPDGKWVAYCSNDSGTYEVYVSPFPEVTRGKWVISDGGGTYPLWSPDGHELFYRNKEAVLAVPVETNPIFKPGKPKVLFWMHDRSAADEESIAPPWDISADGKRFLMLYRVQPYHRVIRISNWLALAEPAKGSR